MRDIDLNTWPRRAHFDFFRAYPQPHFGVTAELEIGALLAALRARGLPFMLSVSYLLTRAAQEVTPFRWRIRGEGAGLRVVEHDVLDPSVTVALPEGDLFGFCTLPYTPDFAAFLTGAREAVALAQAQPTLEDAPGRDDLLFLSSLPWLSFSSVTHAQPSPPDCIPRLTTGKYRPREGGTWMPLDVQVHHALMDGRHLGLYFEAVQALMDQPESWLE